MLPGRSASLSDKKVSYKKEYKSKQNRQERRIYPLEFFKGKQGNMKKPEQNTFVCFSPFDRVLKHLHCK